MSNDPNKMAKPWLEEGASGKTANTKTYQLVWYPPFPDKAQVPYVVGRTRKSQMWEEVTSTAEETKRAGKRKYSYMTETNSELDFIKQYIDMSYTRELILPMNVMPIFTQEYTTQSANKITQYSTLGGNTLVSFGQMPKKISMRVSIIRAGNHWVPFTSMLEAMFQLSGNQAKYSGSLVLFGYDRTKIGKARKYKVVMESMSPTHRSEKSNIIDFDLTLLVAVDYSVDLPSDWGRLAVSKTSAK